MTESLYERALAHLQAGNQAASLGQLEQSLGDFTEGLRCVPTSAGLLLNRSIVYERLELDALAFEDLARLFKLAQGLDRPQQTIAFKRFVALGLKLERTRAVLACLQELELLPQWQSSEFYDLLISHLVLEPEALEVSLPHYLSRAASVGYLTQTGLNLAIESWELHRCSTNAAHSDDQGLRAIDLLAQLTIHPLAPQCVLHAWLDVLARQGLSAAELLEQSTNVLSLWVQLHPLDAAATKQLIQFLTNTNQIDLVEGLFLDLSQRFPQEPIYLLGLARTRVHKRDFERAFVVINAALEMDESSLEIRLERARIFENLLSPHLALVDLKQNLQRDPNHLPTLITQVNVLTDLGRLDEALRLHEQLMAYEMNEGDRLNLQFAKSFIYRLSGKVQEWYAHIEELADQYPQSQSVRCELGWKEVHQGNWPTGFSLLEDRFAAGLHYFPVQPHLEHAKIRRWTPETFHTSVQGKKLLLCGEEGMGDVLQFSRFLPLLQSKGLRITFVCQPALHPLLSFNFPDIQFTSPEVLIKALPQPGAVQYDLYGEIMSTPWVLNLEAHDLSGAPYLKAIPTSIDQMARFKLARLRGQANQFTVGLRWLSSLARSSRSVPLKALRGLGNEPYSVFGLHYGPLKEEDEALYQQWSNFHPTELRLEDLAGLMMNLDCIVTSDTVTAHLAGALGRPTILLKSTFIDWRWGSVGDQSAWYESMSIVRQRQLMNWSEPIAQLIQQLRERMASH